MNNINFFILTPFINKEIVTYEIKYILNIKLMKLKISKYLINVKLSNIIGI